MDRDTMLSRCANKWADLYRYPEGVDFNLGTEVLYNAEHFADLMPMLLAWMQNPRDRKELSVAITDLLAGFVVDEFGNDVDDEEAMRHEEAAELRHFGAPPPCGWESWDDYLNDRDWQNERT